MRLINDYTPPSPEDLNRFKEQLGYTGTQMADLARVASNNHWQNILAANLLVPAIWIIGDNVDIGACTCIVGITHVIGDNVKIGAMSFVNQDIPSNCTCITKKEFHTIVNNN
jgi:acetyltransferase-like isoleucine patch superfamily enzyme